MRTDPVYDVDIYVYMRYRELKLCPSGEFLEFQDEICGKVRRLLVEWICDSAREFNLSTVQFIFLKCLFSNFALIAKRNTAEGQLFISKEQSSLEANN